MQLRGLQTSPSITPSIGSTLSPVSPSWSGCIFTIRTSPTIRHPAFAINIPATDTTPRLPTPTSSWAASWKLSKSNLPPDKTLIVLLADHGESLGDHGEYNHGIFLYDSTVRIPWIMVGPGIPAGVRVQQQAREIDVLPTILDLLGSRPSSAVQGTSMVPAFSGKPVPTTYSYEETLFPKINLGWSELRGIHTAHWMYVRAPRPELYDLDTDPSELHNIIDAHPKEYRELEQQLRIASRTSSAGTETIVADHMDPQTMEQLKSLGYVGGTSEHEHYSSTVRAQIPKIA